MVWSEVITSSIIGVFFIALAVAIICGRIRKKKHDAQEQSNLENAFDDPK